jgi:hypothetical protein
MKYVTKYLFAAVMLVSALFAPMHASAGALSDYAEGAILGHVFQGTPYTGPATTYVGLSTSACSDSSTGTEVTGGSYARVAVTSNGTNWTGPTAGNGTIANGTAVTYPAPTAAWGSVTHWFISDASTAGNMIICAQLTTDKTINNGDAAPSFGVGALTIQVDN